MVVDLDDRFDRQEARIDLRFALGEDVRRREKTVWRREGIQEEQKSQVLRKEAKRGRQEKDAPKTKADPRRRTGTKRSKNPVAVDKCRLELEGAL